jgi:hypothetical protein
MHADRLRQQNGPHTESTELAEFSRAVSSALARKLSSPDAAQRGGSTFGPDPDAMTTVFGVALLIGAWPAYVWLALHTRRAAGRRPLVLLWIGASAVYGYLRYRYTCSQALSCDVGGTSPYFLSGIPYYFIHYVPVFAAIGLVAFGVASVIVELRARGGVRGRSAARTLALGTVGAMASFILASVVAESLSIHPL